VLSVVGHAFDPTRRRGMASVLPVIPSMSARPLGRRLAACLTPRPADPDCPVCPTARLSNPAAAHLASGVGRESTPSILCALPVPVGLPHRVPPVYLSAPVGPVSPVGRASTWCYRFRLVTRPGHTTRAWRNGRRAGFRCQC